MYRDPGSMTWLVVGMNDVDAAVGLLEDVVDDLPGRSGLGPGRVVPVGPGGRVGGHDFQDGLALVQPLVSLLLGLELDGRPAAGWRRANLLRDAVVLARRSLCLANASASFAEKRVSTRSTWMGAGGRLWKAKPRTEARTSGKP